MADEPDLRLLRQAFGPLDPALDPDRMPSETRRRAHTEHLLAEYRSLAAHAAGAHAAGAHAAAAHAPRRRRHSRRRILAMTGAVATAAAGGVVAVIAAEQPRPTPAFAATPAPLPVTGGRGPGAGPLRRLAGIAAARPGPARGATVAHLVLDRWDLSATVGGALVSTAVIASRRELWRAPAGDAVTIDDYLPPEFPTAGDRAAWERQGSPGLGVPSTRSVYGPGRFPVTYAGRPPADPAVLETWLSSGVPGAAAVLRAVTALLREQVPTPREQAALLQVLAAQEGIEHEGRTTDRAGRAGEAFRIVQSGGGREVADRLVLDPATAAVLSHERILIAGALALPVRRPAVIGYTVYRTADLVTTLPG